MNTDPNDMTIRRVKNGWIVMPHAPFAEFPPIANAYVFVSPGALADFIMEHATAQEAGAGAAGAAGHKYPPANAR